MPARYYRLLGILAASVSLQLGACSWLHKSDPAAAAAAPPAQQASVAPEDEMDTESTLWTMLGIVPKASVLKESEKTGRDVSPVLWQATQDSLSFVPIDSQDAMTGLIVTNWYSPKAKPNVRLRVTAFIKSRALRSDSLAVTIERQERSTNGQWQEASVARQVVEDLENDILQRARQIHAERLRAQHQ
jgi:hypothetical protein